VKLVHMLAEVAVGVTLFEAGRALVLLLTHVGYRCLTRL
jgi:hypothetical protein